MKSRYIRFLFVGFTNAVVDLGILNLLLFVFPTQNVFMLLLYNTVAVFFAIINSYIWNTRWTFHVYKQVRNYQKMLFTGQAIVNIIINNAALYVLSLFLPISNTLGYFIGNNIAKLIAMVLASSSSYLLLSFIVFRQTKKIPQDYPIIPRDSSQLLI